MGRFGRLLWLAGGIVPLTVLATQPVESGPPREYEVKAAMLYNLSKFVEWPAAKPGDVSGSFVIGVLGPDPFGPGLEEMLRGKSAAGKPVAVRRFAGLAGVEACHVLFVSRPDGNRLGEIAGNLEKAGVLTVGDAGGFARSGGMVGFVIADNKVQIEINLSATRRAGLTVSSKLLRLAKVVRD